MPMLIIAITAISILFLINPTNAETDINSTPHDNNNNTITDISCQKYPMFEESRRIDDLKDSCNNNHCYWLEAKEQNGTDTGRCYQCSQQDTREGCEGTGVCFWMGGRGELGGSDCTLCAGRTKEDCEGVGYCFWSVAGLENVCSKCPGYVDAESCAAGGCFWRRIKGVERCVKCGGFHMKQNCEAAGCKWNQDNKVKCGANPDIFVLPVSKEEENEKSTETTSAAERSLTDKLLLVFGFLGLAVVFFVF